MRIISIVKEHRAIDIIAFSKAVTCQSGQKVLRKNFLTRQLVTRIREMCDTEKLN